MKGFTKDGKFHPIKPYSKVRKSRDQKVKTEGVRMKRTKDWLDKLNKKQQYQAYLDWSKEREKMYPDEKWELLKKKGLTREKDFKFWKRMEHAIVKGQPEEEGGNIANERKARNRFHPKGYKPPTFGKEKPKGTWEITETKYGSKNVVRDQNEVTIYDDNGQEVVKWIRDEWEEDQSIIHSIKNAKR